MNEILLNHTISGDPEGIPVLMIPPLGGDHEFWTFCRNQLGPAFLTIAVDLRGSGGSPMPDGPLRLNQNVRDIDVLRRHLGVTGMVVMGCAVGAMTAALYAAQHSDHTRALVMSNPGIRITPEASQNLQNRAALVRAQGMQAILPGAVDVAFAGYERTKERDRYLSRFAAQSAEGYALSVLGACGADIAEALGEVRCPTLMVSGARDSLMPSWHAEDIKAALPAAKALVLEQGAHFIPYQQPAAFADLVRDFLGEALPASAD